MNLRSMIDKVDPLPDSVSYRELDRILLLGCRFVSYRLRLHKQVASMSPRLSTAVFWILSNAYGFLIIILRKIVPERYTDADPYKHIHVDPSNIEFTTDNVLSKRRGWVVDGQWDLSRDGYMHRTFASAIEQRFVKEMDWKKTVLADKYDGSKFDQRCASIDQLYEHIREDGYKSQQQLLEDDPNAAWSGLNDAMHPLANEVTVDIGRNGELLWNICGQHRLAIAKILGIDQIPVQVFRRHKQWQTIRNKVRNGEDIPEEFLDHPDLNDLLNREQYKDQ